MPPWFWSAWPKLSWMRQNLPFQRFPMEFSITSLDHQMDQSNYIQRNVFRIKNATLKMQMRVKKHFWFHHIFIVFLTRKLVRYIYITFFSSLWTSMHTSGPHWQNPGAATGWFHFNVETGAAIGRKHVFTMSDPLSPPVLAEAVTCWLLYHSDEYHAIL